VNRLLDSPLGVIFIGFILVLLGVLLPFLMVIGILESGFFLSFISYFASLIGMIVGLLGAAMFVKERRDE
jgi:membrane associated rhomboid family serine protease